MASSIPYDMQLLWKISVARLPHGQCCKTVALDSPRPQSLLRSWRSRTTPKSKRCLMHANCPHNGKKILSPHTVSGAKIPSCVLCQGMVSRDGYRSWKKKTDPTNKNQKQPNTQERKTGETGNTSKAANVITKWNSEGLLLRRFQIQTLTCV